MPYSSPLLDRTVAEIVKFVSPSVFFDLGAGAGKYGTIVSKLNPKPHSVAIEIERDYINKFKLSSIYSEVWQMSVMDLLNSRYYDTIFDTVMIGDIIEHLKKSDGIDLLNFLVYRSRWIIVQFPEKYIQNTTEGYSNEAHISVWGTSDFQSFENSGILSRKDQRLVVIKGYLEDKINIKKINAIVNKHEKQKA